MVQTLGTVNSIQSAKSSITVRIIVVVFGIFNVTETGILGSAGRHCAQHGIGRVLAAIQDVTDV